MSAAFTPGPWHVIKKAERVGYADYEIAWSGDDELVADVVYTEGDANLIAAAPDLLEALKAVINECKGYVPNTSKAVWRDAYAAIAKATGEAS